MGIRAKRVLIFFGVFVLVYAYLYYPKYLYRIEGTLSKLGIQEQCGYVSEIGPNIMGRASASYGCSILYDDASYETVKAEVERMERVLKDRGWRQTEQTGRVDKNYSYTGRYVKSTGYAEFYIKIETQEIIRGPETGRKIIFLLYRGNLGY